MRRPLEVEFESKWAAVVRGPGAWELCKDAGRRKPAWSRQGRGWVVRERTARDVIAAAEHAGVDVVITGPRSAAQTETVQRIAQFGLEPEGLW